MFSKIWKTKISLNQKMVPIPWFSIILWYSSRGFHLVVLNHYMVSIKWFLNQKMVSLNMVSQSKNGFPKDGFSIRKWIPKRWFLNQKMDSQKMVSQSKNGFPKYGFSIKKWFP